MPRRPPVFRSLSAALTCSAAFFLAPPAQAQQAPDLQLPRTTLGTVGLIEMPSARMANDGELSFGASYMRNTQHYDLGFQILPWLEASFRYSGINNFFPGYPVYWDRSLGMKLRLLEERDTLPAISVGINDIVGTGVYGGEYIVASKQFGDFDATLGIGWGRLGSANTFRNPLTLLSNSFEFRPDLLRAGGANFSTFFHGHTAGVYGGVSWRTPIDGLSLSVEDSSDNYPLEQFFGSFHPRSPVNVGASYQITDGVQLNVGYLYGTTVSGGINLQFDPTRDAFPAKVGPPPPTPVVRPPEAQQAALRSLLGQRNPQFAVDRVRAADRGAFVDALWSNRAVRDVKIIGSILTITAASSDTRGLCGFAAETATGYGMGFSRVVVHNAAGKMLAQCTMPSLVRPTVRNATIPLSSIAAAYHEPFLINASDVQPPADAAASARKFRADATKQRLRIEAVTFTETEAIVYYNNDHYWQEANALQRLVALLTADAPATVEKFRLVAVENGFVQREFHLLRASVERSYSENTDRPTAFPTPMAVQSAPLENPVLERQWRHTFPRFDWDIYPQFRQQFFDPSNPVGVQFVGAAGVNLELMPGLSVWAEGEVNLFDTFTTNRFNDSILPHVRTDFAKFFKEGANGIGGMQLNYRTKLAPELYATARVGLLESMFGGGGGEVLYAPDNARWAIGADLYEVWLRNFDRLFGLQGYHVTTGHVTLYWASPFWDLDFQARAGQYLAGDRGLTLQITRRFASGIEVGAFFTKTNVSSQDFGEGSFDKGIIIRIPLGFAAPIDSQNRIAMDLRPVQRDGGQLLLNDATLYEETRRTSEAEMVRTGASFDDTW